MKNTGCLNVLCDSNQDIGKVVIHPNDGFDLDLFKLSYPILIYHGMSVEEFKEGNGENIPGELILSNDCKVGRVELSKKLCGMMNYPDKAVLVYSEGRLLLAVR